MAINAEELIQFAIKLIDIQIKKYEKLVKIGVGPDAKMNSILVQREVEDILNNLERLFEVKQPSQEDLLGFAQLLHFYLKCEYIRGRSAWLLDENNIHNVEYDRVSTQLNDLSEIVSNQELTTQPSKELTENQQQCLHDSHEIAFLILDLAIKLKENPQRTDLGDTSDFGHGFRIMKKHAQPSGRYHDPSISDEMAQRHRQSTHFLQQSSLTKTEESFNKQKAAEFTEKDRERLKTILDNFLLKYPNSELSRGDFKWYQVGVTAKPKTTSQSYGLKGLSLFAVALVGASVAAYSTYASMTSDEQDNTGLRF